MSISQQLKAIVALLEDTDGVVSESVDSYLREHFDEVSAQLPDIAYARNQDGGWALLVGKMRSLNSELTLKELEQVVKTDGENYIYEWFLMNKLILFPADYSSMYATLLTMSYKVESQISPGALPAHKVDAINRVFFEEFSMTALRDEDIPLEALLPVSVLETRHGISLVIDMLYVFLADLLDYPLKVFVSDMGFIPVWVDDDGSPLFFINLGEKGRMISISDVLDGDDDVSNLYFDDVSSLLDIYAAVLSDIFSISGEGERSKLMMKVHTILQRR
ncbi:hypothetical protein B5F83_04005 [Muribaculum sp. An289]|jgi:hypothetical protein|uniref:Protein SirB1 N-terminal domain-containing protein n=1 Tax=Candidatus Merdivivens faecigallinarum TaxID=2840871 RepID=A0A9D9NQA1_9BACT|nr:MULTISPECIES: transglutaminase family protein [unclassified Muribaculum]MBO8481816.1 hypothetical protein [Candidatus Merdivivens faecigallinarum]OUO37401.1 hypothetical protein B5F83_04005 [Muribaculum sp. An289]OUO43320.1 hypothetical protein B5F81_03565 [Muribaculum sp. An287]